MRQAAPGPVQKICLLLDEERIRKMSTLSSRRVGLPSALHHLSCLAGGSRHYPDRQELIGQRPFASTSLMSWVHRTTRTLPLQQYSSKTILSLMLRLWLLHGAESLQQLSRTVGTKATRKFRLEREPFHLSLDEELKVLVGAVSDD